MLTEFLRKFLSFLAPVPQQWFSMRNFFTMLSWINLLHDFSVDPVKIHKKRITFYFNLKGSSIRNILSKVEIDKKIYSTCRRKNAFTLSITHIVYSDFISVVVSMLLGRSSSRLCLSISPTSDKARFWPLKLASIAFSLRAVLARAVFLRRKHFRISLNSLRKLSLSQP